MTTDADTQLSKNSFFIVALITPNIFIQLFLRYIYIPNIMLICICVCKDNRYYDFSTKMNVLQ